MDYDVKTVKHNIFVEAGPKDYILMLTVPVIGFLAGIIIKKLSSGKLFKHDKFLNLIEKTIASLAFFFFFTQFITPLYAFTGAIVFLAIQLKFDFLKPRTGMGYFGALYSFAQDNLLLMIFAIVYIAIVSNRRAFQKKTLKEHAICAGIFYVAALVGFATQNEWAYAFFRAIAFAAGLF